MNKMNPLNLFINREFNLALLVGNIYFLDNIG